MKGTSIIVSSIYLISNVITDSNSNYFKPSKKLIKIPVFVFNFGSKLLSENLKIEKQHCSDILSVCILNLSLFQ